MATLSSIPQPPTTLFLANIPLMDRDHPNESFKLLADKYGEIYNFRFPDGRVVVHINTHNLLAQISNDKHFKKVVTSPLDQVRNLAGDGLFTAGLEEVNWGTAHRILMPAFGPANTRNMFGDMKDICEQLMLKWERFGSESAIDPAEDFTRLTFDTIALCSMSYRFNSFYDAAMPKFTREMVDVLIESTNRAYRSPFSKALPFKSKSVDEKYYSEIRDMRETASELVRKRKEHPIEKKDLLALMLEGKDPKTGEGLSDVSIVNNLITFLVAGHETTSGMLGFTIYHLLKNPDALFKLRDELDRVVGGKDISIEHLDKLEYLIAVMRESLRLTPTATARSVVPFEDTVLIGGDGDERNPANKKYEVKKGVPIMAHISLIQSDPLVWGQDVELFRPERMLSGFETLPAHAWQPFGFGLRGCIGRPFAWQEAQLVLASIFSKFDVFLADPGYNLQVKQTITVKPSGLRIRVRPRSLGSTVPRTVGRADAAPLVSTKRTSESAPERAETRSLHVFYGSNTGSSEGFAGRITSDAASHGFKPTIATLDSATGNIPLDGPVIIITASFEGEPADNAAQFVSWLQNMRENGGNTALKDLSYAVFGCGNHEWARTYQRIPKLCDDILNELGAKRILERGSADAASPSFFQSFEDWEGMLWKKLDEVYHSTKPSDIPATLSSTALKVDVIESGSGRAKLLRQPDAAMAKVVENRLLSKHGSPTKRHIVLALPHSMLYLAGDYLAILPVNPSGIVGRALVRFALSSDQEVIIKSDGALTLPRNSPISCEELLKGYVELSQPATTRDIQSLEALALSESIVSSLRALREDFDGSVLSRRVSVLDILEKFSDIQISFAAFLQMLPPMRIRQYSISSSPLANAEQVSLTISVVNSEAHSGSGYRYLGVASNYLASLKADDRVPVVVRPSNATFHLPSDPSIPIVMFCCGSGIAPFRGFIEERATQKASGRDVGKMMLFFGCRSPDDDFLYSDSDLAAWTAEGIIDVRPAFSRKTEDSMGCHYVQDRIWQSRDDIVDLYRKGAKLYTCGTRKASEGIREACINLLKYAKPEFSDETASLEFERIQKERYATDVFD